MEKTCYNCGSPISKETCEDFPEVCEHWSPKKPLTNADIIRAMTNKELAEWIALKVECLWCPAKPQEGKCMPRLNPKMDCVDAVLDWLKQEVKG